MESWFSHFGPARHFVAGLLAGSIFSLRGLCVIAVLTVLFAGMKTDNVTCQQIQARLNQWVFPYSSPTPVTYWATGWNYLAFLSGTPIPTTNRWPYEEIGGLGLGLLLGSQIPAWVVLLLLGSSYVWLDRVLFGLTCRQHLSQAILLLRSKITG